MDRWGFSDQYVLMAGYEDELIVHPLPANRGFYGQVGHHHGG